MIAGAKDIDPSMIGIVYLVSELPSISIKLSAPYWFHRVPYRSRVIAATVLMMLSFTSVALGGLHDLVSVQLLGVALGAAQSGVGEASFLALSSFYNPSRTALTAWSSGTGVAGIVGYAWVVFFRQVLKFSFPTTLFIALALFPAAYLGVFEVVMQSPSPAKIAAAAAARVAKLGGGGRTVANPLIESSSSSSSSLKSSARTLSTYTSENKDEGGSCVHVATAAENIASGSASLSFKERLDATLALWPYMVPLAVVYFAEYLIQAGAWSAMGFPVTDASARKEFYEYANWTYQAGVVVSRSSGTLWTPTRRKLWLIPVLQCGLLVFSIINAYSQIWYNWSVLAMSFVVGLLGGAVYVGGFSLIAMESPLHLKEFNLGAASVAGGAGIAFADISSIYLQRSIYKHFNIQD